jgi:hypothetical protein
LPKAFVDFARLIPWTPEPFFVNGNLEMPMEQSHIVKIVPKIRRNGAELLRDSEGCTTSRDYG